MALFTNPLDHVTVAAPCSADWNEMAGDEQVRFCSQCSLNVYNLSSMSKREAESLIARTEGRLCVRFYRRTDGTILTNNCPVGLRAIRRRLSRITTAIISAVLSFFAGLGIYAGLNEKDSAQLRTTTGVLISDRPQQPAPPVTSSPPTEIMGAWIDGEPEVGRLEMPRSNTSSQSGKKARR
jgi:hypothetical protein